MGSGCIEVSLASQLVETVSYVFNNIPLLKERALEMINVEKLAQSRQHKVGPKAAKRIK